jgi:hypothetical protein
MTLLLAFLFGSLILGFHAADAIPRIHVRLVMAGSFVLALAYLNLRFV